LAQLLLTKEKRPVELCDAIEGRRTVRAFGPDPVPDQTVTEIFEAGTWAPSHGNKQPWEFVLIGPATRAGLAMRYQAMLEAGPLKNAELAEARKQALRNFAKDFGGAPLLFAVVCPPATTDLDRYDFPLAAAAALQNIFLAAWERRIGGVWLSIGSNPQIRELLGVQPGSTVAGIVAMGFPDSVPAPQPRAQAADKTRRLP